MGWLIGHSPPIPHIEMSQQFPNLWCPNNPYDLNPILGLPSTLNLVQNNQRLDIEYYATPLFKQLHSTILFRQLWVLTLRVLPNETHVLPYLEHIKVLEIYYGTIPAYSVDIALPLIHTLQQLLLHQSTTSWMLGRTFTALKECELWNSPGGMSSCEGPQVDSPACTAFTASRG